MQRRRSLPPISGRMTLLPGVTGTPGTPGYSNPFQPIQPGGLPPLPSTGGGGGGNGGGFWDTLVGIGSDWARKELGLGGGGTSGSTPAEGSGPCPQGYQFNARTLQCEEIGLGGAIERTLPGGQTGTMADAYGQATVGAFGIPALVPAQRGTTVRSDGTTHPILKCPPGAVLGKDNLCYMKGSIPRQFRKWKPAAKPVVSAHDAKMMRKYGPGGSKQNRVKKLAQTAGFSCRKR